MNKKIIVSLAIIAVVGAGITLGVTGAYFTDKEPIEENVFQAGTLDIKQGVNDLGNITLSGLVPGVTTDPQRLEMGNNGSLHAVIDKIEVTSLVNDDVSGNKVEPVDYANSINVTISDEVGKPVWKGTLGNLNGGNAIDGTDKVFLAKKGSGVNYTTRDYWFTFELDSSVDNNYQNEGVNATLSVNATQVKNNKFDAAERLVANQNNDNGWDWTEDENPGNSSFDNLYGVTAIGLLKAYEFSGNSDYFDTAEDAAYAIYNGDKPDPKWEDGGEHNVTLLFLQRIGKYLGNDGVYDNGFNNTARDAVVSRWDHYDNDAQKVYDQIKSKRSSNPDLFYWDLAPLMEVTLDVANTISDNNQAITLRNNALDLAELVASDQKSSGWFTSGANDDYQLGQASAIRILQLADDVSLDVDYGSQISDAANALWSHKNSDNSFQAGENKSIQTSSYVALAFEMIGHHGKAIKVIDYIMSQQLSNGSWYGEDGITEYPEINSEALRAILSVTE